MNLTEYLQEEIRDEAAVESGDEGGKASVVKGKEGKKKAPERGKSKLRVTKKPLELGSYVDKIKSL